MRKMKKIIINREKDQNIAKNPFISFFSKIFHSLSS